MSSSNIGILIFGPTGSGKSDLANFVANQLKAEILVCDSVQVYKSFDIGSAKPSQIDRVRIPHHMVDVCEPFEEMDAASYSSQARQRLIEILERKKIPIVVAGSGLYLRAFLGENFEEDVPTNPRLRERIKALNSKRAISILKRLNPKRALELHPNDLYRVKRAIELSILRFARRNENEEDAKPSKEDLFTKSAEALGVKWICVFVNPDRKVLHKRIADRCSLMLQGGWLQEVKLLCADPRIASSRAMQAIGYKEISQALFSLKLNRELDQDGLRKLEQKIVESTRQYAKRQITWFKKLPCHVPVTNSDAPSMVWENILSYAKTKINVEWI